MTTNFEAVCEGVKGMSSAAILERLNGYVQAMKPGQYYLEIGTCNGRTLIGAMIGHEFPGIAVDDFSEFNNELWTPSKTVVEANLKAWNVAHKVQFHEMEFHNFFEEYGKLPPIGVYFYDGDHKFQPQLEGMYLGFDRLEIGGVIAVDDLGFPDVSRACREFERNASVEILEAHYPKPLPGQAYDPDWWNGFIAYRKVA